MQIFLFFALFISVLAVIFAVQNNSPTTVSFVGWDYQASLALVLLIALAAGALISFFFSLPANIKTRLTIRQQRKKINEMESNLAGLRQQLDETQKMVEQLKAPVLPPAPKPEPPMVEPTSLVEEAEVAKDQPST